jgi:molybdenum cofactor cytidylyltransferase
MARDGCLIERFLAPVEPGNLFLLSYKDNIPIVFGLLPLRQAEWRGFSVSPMLARYRVPGWEVACLGHGGLLT